MREESLGSKEAGKRIDIVVLARHLFEIDPMQIHAVPVILTTVNGTSCLRLPTEISTANALLIPAI